ncbi:MAG: DUF2254 family protein [Verrucomicrobiales bacterium]
MNGWVAQKARSLWEGLWFVPGVIAVLSILLGVLLSGMGGWSPAGALGWEVFDSKAASDVLTTLAGAAITVAAVVFSITMVVLSSASAQFGPRLLPNFMKRTQTKLAVGGFIGSFSYQIVVSTALALGVEVPDLAVWVGILGSLGGFGILLSFIHLVASFIQVPFIIEDVSGDLVRGLSRFVEHGAGRGNAGEPAIRREFKPVGVLRASRSGYLQEIDTKRLVKEATRADMLVRVRAKAGDFLVEGDEVATVFGLPGAEGELGAGDGVFVIGVNRSSPRGPSNTAREALPGAVKVFRLGRWKTRRRHPSRRSGGKLR